MFKKPSTYLLLASNVVIYGVVIAIGIFGPSKSSANANGPPLAKAATPYVVFAYNDLGMHCINQDFSELCVLPPANTLRAQVIYRGGEDPQIVTSGIQVQYSIPGNTESASKTNFWKYAAKLFGKAPPLNVGLFGFGLSGNMALTPNRDFWAHGIPITQVTDAGKTDCYQLARVNVLKGTSNVATTLTVVPVSWEMSCNRCHNLAGSTTAMSILKAHDLLHGSHLATQKPVLCASCHADPALGAKGVTGVLPLSIAMHAAHAPRMGRYAGNDLCYSCHPGPQTQCLRDIHHIKGLTCQSCHISMAAVGNPRRRPWQDEPRCGTCHKVAGHQYEQAGVLFRDSVGHNGVKCIACHGSPHAITPSSNPRDNVEATLLQGKVGTISKCTVCHSTQPTDPFNHTAGD